MSQTRGEDGQQGTYQLWRKQTVETGQSAVPLLPLFLTWCSCPKAMALTWAPETPLPPLTPSGPGVVMASCCCGSPGRLNISCQLLYATQTFINRPFTFKMSVEDPD